MHSYFSCRRETENADFALMVEGRRAGLTRVICPGAVVVAGSVMTESSFMLSPGVELGGPMKLRTTGRNTRPWKRPKKTTRKNTLKKARKKIDLVNISTAKAKNVEKPPFSTAGPRSTRAMYTRSFRVPVATIKAWAM